eukprot:TRINITY_DN1179_c0_g1_i2.p1 TRINITY_DN1179_c0_g1~~TRINITY_DN1179_c0_g1_i2.p1  ORF type:complete len:918 (+),score=142.54 TRINITY_DN1179_c0_g1_i2:98-2755(+)
MNASYQDAVSYLSKCGMPELMDSFVRRVLSKRPSDRRGIVSVIRDFCTEQLGAAGCGCSEPHAPPRPCTADAAVTCHIVPTTARSEAMLPSSRRGRHQSGETQMSSPQHTADVILDEAPHATGQQRQPLATPAPVHLHPPHESPRSGLRDAARRLRNWLLHQEADASPAPFGEAADPEGRVTPDNGLGGDLRRCMATLLDWVEIHALLSPQDPGKIASPLCGSQMLRTPVAGNRLPCSPSDLPAREKREASYRSERPKPVFGGDEDHADAPADSGAMSPAALSRVKSGQSIGERQHSMGPSQTPMSRRSNSVSRAPRRGRSKSRAGAKEKEKEMCWKRGALLGRGAFGTVHVGLNSGTGELMAVKTIEFNPQDPEIRKKLTALQNEISLMKNLDHPSIVKYLCTEREANSFNIFMEYVPGGSILDLLKQFGALPNDAACYYAREILIGLQYLHSQSVIHRDIKGANILLTVEGECKLADFGCSGKLSDVQPRRSSIQGTPLWMAPEVICQQPYDKSVDIWSTGCTVIEMLTGDAPFMYLGKGQLALLQFICDEDEPIDQEMPQDQIEGESKDFIVECLQREPADRPIPDYLLEHEWIRGLDEEDEVLMTSVGLAGLTAPAASPGTGPRQNSFTPGGRVAPHSPRQGPAGGIQFPGRQNSHRHRASDAPGRGSVAPALPPALQRMSNVPQQGGDTSGPPSARGPAAHAAADAVAERARTVGLPDAEPVSPTRQRSGNDQEFGDLASSDGPPSPRGLPPEDPVFGLKVQVDPAEFPAVVPRQGDEQPGALPGLRPVPSMRRAMTGGHGDFHAYLAGRANALTGLAPTAGDEIKSKVIDDVIHEEDDYASVGAMSPDCGTGLDGSPVSGFDLSGDAVRSGSDSPHPVS